MKSIKLKIQKGFTLIEATVAISILSLAITAPMLIAQKSISSAIYSKEQVTASYLAQEAVEFIKNIRDYNRINDKDWLDGLRSYVSNATDIYFMIDSGYLDISNNDFFNEAVVPCDANACANIGLSKSSTEYYYGQMGYDYSNWTQTPFIRSVKLSETPADPGANREIKIQVKVEWKTNYFSPTKSIVINDYMFNF